MMNAPKVRQHCRTQAEREAAKKAMLASATATFETHVKKAAGGQLKAPDLCDLAKQIVCALVWQLAEATSGFAPKKSMTKSQLNTYKRQGLAGRPRFAADHCNFAYRALPCCGRPGDSVKTLKSRPDWTPVE